MRRNEAGTSSQNLTAKCNNHTACEIVKPYFGTGEINKYRREESEEPLTPGLFDEIFEGVGSPSPGSSPGGFAARDPADAEPYLDTILRKESTENKRRSQGKLFFRAEVGMAVPGDYSWLTFTSSGDSPELEKSWKKLRWWLTRNYPEWRWMYCMTDEGGFSGVIHMIVRRPKGSERPDIAPIKEYWNKIHLAHVVNIKDVYDPRGLANYISDQRRKRGLSVEISNQGRGDTTITRWRMGHKWLPKAFIAAAGRFWYKSEDLKGNLIRNTLLTDWLRTVLKNYDAIKDPPWCHGDRWHWSCEKDMTKPLIKKFPGGVFKFIAKGDTYQDPNGQVKPYETTKVMMSVAGAKQAAEIPKDAYHALVQALTLPEVQDKLRDWE